MTMAIRIAIESATVTPVLFVGGVVVGEFCAISLSRITGETASNEREIAEDCDLIAQVVSYTMDQPWIKFL